jgi:hypothetical protein
MREATATTPHSMIPQEQFGDYRILRVIGQGGMGTVCLAVQRGLDRTVALKVLHPDLAGNVDSERRFQCIVKLADFGLARKEGNTILTQEGDVVGTLRYMAPEMILGANATIQSDLWSMGGVLFTLLTGEEHIDVRELMERPGSACAYRLPDEIDGPPSLARVLAWLLSPDPAQRPRGAADVRDALEGILREASLPPAEDILLKHPLAPLPTPASPAQYYPTQVTPVSPRARRPRTADRTPAPAQRRKQPKAASVMGLLGVGALLVLGVSHLLSPKHPPVPPASPRATVRPTPTPLPKRGAFQDWPAVVPYATVLSGSPSEARAAVAQLKRRLPIKLDNDPARWLYWMRLGRWFDDPQRSKEEPRFARASAEPMDFIQEHAVVPNLFRLAPTPDAYGFVVLGTAAWPMDGRFWMALGRLLSLDGYTASARIAYDIGLERLGKFRIVVNQGALLDAIAEAVVLSVKHNPDQLARIITVVAGSKQMLWDFLRVRLEVKHSALLQAILMSAQVYDPGTGVPAIELAKMLGSLGQPEEARQILKVAMARFPHSQAVREMLCMHYLARARVKEAQALILRLPGESMPRSRFPFVAEGKQPQMPPLNKDHFDVVDTISVCDLVWWHLAAGRLAETVPVLQELRRMVARVNRDTGLTLLNLVAEGSTAPWPMHYVDEFFASDHDDVIALPHVVDVLSTTPSRWKALIAYAERIRSGAVPKLIEAVCASRGGDLRRSLELLAGSEAKGSLPVHEAMTGEVLARPLIRERAGEHVDPDVLELARRHPQLPISPWETYLSAVRRGSVADMKNAVEVLIDQEYDRAATVIALRWCACLSPPGAEREALEQRAQILTRVNRLPVWLLKHSAEH